MAHQVRRVRNRHFAAAFSAASVYAIGGVIASAHDLGNHDHSHASGYVHENGIGPDPDNDTNPATDTGSISITGGAADVTDDPPYAVINFEAPPGGHGDVIKQAYKEEYGVTFFPKVTRQLCAGQQHFQYDSQCTYEAAPSGHFAVSYLDYLNRPLILEFDRPICVVTMAIYPTGAKQGEEFELKIQGWTDSDKPLDTVKAEFEWTKDTVRWRHMAGAYYLGERASKIAISMRSKDGKEAKKVLRFLIDDLATVETGCEAALAEIATREGVSFDGANIRNDGATETGGSATSEPVISVAEDPPAQGS